ncbi:MAG TPA: hydroxymethylglutaryl-CoA synthase [Candidatus Binatia bacterium]|jgi:hydroxymethylglutaryl-CoA synthase|nr:hydroxymethylglutaryl-CoA synthase [Candidatus Binatia bacterium]
MSVGVERLHAYVPAHRLPLADPASAGGTIEVALAVPGENTITMAATAAARLLRADDTDPGDVGLLLVATNAAAPVSPVVHELTGLGARCRLLDVRHPWCAGTAALSTAADWVRAGGMRARRALVVAADVRVDGSRPMGAGAVAMLVGTEPRAVVFADDAVAWTGAADAAALEGAFLAWRSRERPEPEGTEALTDRLARVVYAASSPDAARDAHRRVIERDWRANERRWSDVEARLAEALAAATVEQVDPALAVACHAGDTGAASLGLALAALLEAEGRILSGRRVGCFAAGGGSAELFTALVSGRAGSEAGVASGPRVAVTPAEYDALCRRTAPPEGFAGDFVCGADGTHRRVA